MRLTYTVCFQPVLFPTASGITYQQAYDTCYSNLTLADYGDVCKDLLDANELPMQVTDCVNDIKVSDISIIIMFISVSETKSNSTTVP